MRGKVIVSILIGLSLMMSGCGNKNKKDIKEKTKEITEKATEEKIETKEENVIIDTVPSNSAKLVEDSSAVNLTSIQKGDIDPKYELIKAITVLRPNFIGVDPFVFEDYPDVIFILAVNELSDKKELDLVNNVGLTVPPVLENLTEITVVSKKSLEDFTQRTFGVSILESEYAKELYIPEIDSYAITLGLGGALLPYFDEMYTTVLKTNNVENNMYILETGYNAYEDVEGTPKGKRIATAYLFLEELNGEFHVKWLYGVGE